MLVDLAMIIPSVALQLFRQVVRNKLYGHYD